ncbi:MAG: adenine phosphoribosyltransferase [Planctomycetaceae bacterium]|jgi:adenine phosphoribosyltransferase|nr:adenine phosphoribosyltransferase [Planctomycetaceae bacterium]MBT4887629.1 adenine phosphoribosyltransferase [Planctomycetaceae bacterium]MBT6643118.1 adenine phosphoribosyltransferase [Planctomycetaceae bacterium]MBT7729157.1 adenine phosphoribosyltransferase [Planctomycetaceae bacterium]
MDLKKHIRDVPDFPKPGILFRDITPLLASREAFGESIRKLAEPWQNKSIDHVAAVEARGFLFAGPLALQLGVGLIPVRKPGKLPADTISYQYDLEYGTDTLEMHKGIVMPQSRVLVIDDVLATGGTAEACVNLLESIQAIVVGCSFLVELKALGGRQRLGDHQIETVLTY